LTLTLSLGELLALVLAAVTLAVTDGSALSRLGMAWLAKQLGVRPDEIRATSSATDDESGEEGDRAG